MREQLTEAENFSPLAPPRRALKALVAIKTKRRVLYREMNEFVFSRDYNMSATLCVGVFGGNFKTSCSLFTSEKTRFSKEMYTFFKNFCAKKKVLRSSQFIS